jgi:GNAT superfamily N-acetyltransferase
MATISVARQPSEAIRAVLYDRLLAFNEAASGEAAYAPLAVVIEDDDGRGIAGGLWGETYYDWMFVELLFVPEALRGEGLGARLLAEAEAIARERGCRHAWLDSYSFQAPGFYLKQGYEVFGTLPDYPRGVERFFLRKRL